MFGDPNGVESNNEGQDIAVERSLGYQYESSSAERKSNRATCLRR
jgi:hypothetical protein